MHAMQRKLRDLPQRRQAAAPLPRQPPGKPLATPCQQKIASKACTCSVHLVHAIANLHSILKCAPPPQGTRCPPTCHPQCPALSQQRQCRLCVWDLHPHLHPQATNAPPHCHERGSLLLWRILGLLQSWHPPPPPRAARQLLQLLREHGPLQRSDSAPHQPDLAARTHVPSHSHSASCSQSAS